MPMNYLERNELIMVEVAQQLASRNFQRGREVGTPGTRMQFTPVGSFFSTVLGRDLFVGLKECVDGDTVDDRVDMELARIAVIAKYLPHLEPTLPVFHGLMVNSTGKESAIITEDFSEGGCYGISSDIPPSLLPYELMELDSYLKDLDHHQKLFELARWCLAVVRGHGRFEARISDLDSFLFGQSMQQVLTRFPIDCTFEDFIRYTRRNRVHCRYLL